MILPRFFIAAVLGLAACQSTPPESSAERLATITATAAPPATAFPATTIPRSSAQMRIVQLSTPPPPTDEQTTRWLETEMNGVRLGMWRPDGWMTDVSEGLLLFETDDDPMSIYCTVPLLNEFHLRPNAANNALDVLKQVVEMPAHMGPDMRMSEPTAFQWDNHPAAYYVFSAGDGTRMLVLALDVPNKRQIVVCAISIEVGAKNRIRTELPALLDGLMIDGTSLRGESLNALPDPLPFPRYYQIAPSSGR